MNAIISLEGIIDNFIDLIEVKPFLVVLQKDTNSQIKKEASKVLSKMAKVKPSVIKPEISVILQSINDLELSVKIVLSKSILEIAKNSPDIIPLDSIIDLFSDQDSFIRESGAKILGFIGYKAPEKAVNILINKGLGDKDWIVRDATVASLGRIVENIPDKELIIKKLVSLLDDEQTWVRRSAINILSDIKEIKASQIPFEKVINNLESEDPKVRESSAGLLKIYGFQNIDRVFENIIILLADEFEDVRNRMINTTVEIIQKIGLSNILSRLLKNLSDESSIELQQSIALILERTAKYENDKIKKRVISLLKIRCEMSQDPIICGTLHKLSEN
jgi:HEAT repeat protein